SSRRRHTRFSRDWSSDVCSSDLAFGLTAQMRSAAVSIPSNVAEGFGRAQRRSFAQFLRIAQGSLKELETQAQLSVRIGRVPHERSEERRVGKGCLAVWWRGTASQ